MATLSAIPRPIDSNCILYVNTSTITTYTEYGMPVTMSVSSACKYVGPPHGGDMNTTLA